MNVCSCSSKKGCEEERSRVSFEIKEESHCDLFGCNWEKKKEELFSNPSFFLKRKTYLFDTCCGHQMLRVKRIRHYKCTVCGTEKIVRAPIAVCKICNTYTEMEYLDEHFDDDFGL